MAKIRFKVEVHGVLDTNSYPIPSDGRLTLQLQDDVKNAIESEIDVSVNAIKVTKVNQKNDEVRDND